MILKQKQYNFLIKPKNRIQLNQKIASRDKMMYGKNPLQLLP